MRSKYRTTRKSDLLRVRRVRGRVSTSVIGKMVQRIVRQFWPEQVILFGSYARGDANEDSDVDFLVVMPVQGSKAEQEVRIGVALHDFPVAKDIVVSTPDEFAWRKDIVGTIEYPAVREGKVLYVKQ